MFKNVFQTCFKNDSNAFRPQKSTFSNSYAIQTYRPHDDVLVMSLQFEQEYTNVIPHDGMSDRLLQKKNEL